MTTIHSSIGGVGSPDIIAGEYLPVLETPRVTLIGTKGNQGFFANINLGRSKDYFICEFGGL